MSWKTIRYDWPLHFVLRITNFLPDNIVFLKLRGRLASHFIGKCGNDLRLGRNITFYNPSKIEIGSHCYIAYGNWFSANETITIGDEVVIGPYCVFASSNHTKEGKSYRYGAQSCAKIVISSGCWIAAHCTVTAGSNLPEQSVLAANSVLTSAHHSQSGLYAGAPAQLKRADK